MYDLFIDCVNGDSIRLQTEHDDAKAVLAFLEKNDHEGSAIALHRLDDKLDMWHNEEVYSYLRAQA